MTSWIRRNSFCSLLLVLAFTPFGQALVSLIKYRPITRSCGTERPSQMLQDSHRWLHENEVQDNELWNSSMVDQRWAGLGSDLSARDQLPRPRQALTPFPNSGTPLFFVETHFHIVADSSSASPSSSSYVTDTMIQNQFSYLQNAYANTGIGYRLTSVDRTINDTWAANGDDKAMKQALRQGTYASLNVYYQSQLQATSGTPGIPAGSTLLGFCSLPSSGFTPTTSPAYYVSDGCNILSGTMPGGNVGGYNLGATTAHEVGHWNGLLHPFSGYTCDPYDFGDYVADTPQESTSTNGCPASKDSCPNSGVAPGYTGASDQGGDPYGPQGYSGPDPIHNFMDYSNDACYTGFTSGQAARAINLWQLYRHGL